LSKNQLFITFADITCATLFDFLQCFSPGRVSSYATNFLRIRPILFFTLFLIHFNTSGQIKEYRLEGYLYEYNTVIPIQNAIIRTNLGQSSTTKGDGHYSLILPEGKYDFTITHILYDTLFRSIKINKHQELRLYLNLRSSMMKEVIISNHQKNIAAIAPNVSTLSKKDIEKAPSFFGQRDPLKAIQTLPGTGKGGEGNSGFYVRGGTSGQNLTLLNDAIIYNPSHLLGLFSIFNSSIVDNINLYKSAIPAEYGGRLSSIIEVNSSKRISDSLNIDGDVSILSASANVDIPINTNWSVTASGRSSFMNYTVWPVVSSLGLSSRSFNRIKYDFRDFNLNSNARIGKNDFLHFSAYSGGDDFGFDSRININNSMDWQNQAGSLTWKKLISNNITLNTTISYSGYRFNFGLDQDQNRAGISSRIKDYNFKSSLNTYVHGHYIKAGVQYTDHDFKPNTPYVKSAGIDYDFGTPNTYYSDESSVFLSDEFNISENLGVYAGTRLTYYRHKGPYKIVNDDKSELIYNKHSVVSSFLYLEPSITFRQLLNTNSSLKFSFSRNVQPVHLISVTAVNFPADFWMPSLSNIPPEKGLQTSVGYFLNLGKKYESYIDLYYKKMNGLVEFSGGIMNLIDNLKIEDNLLFGSGKAYGAEFFMKKKTGRFTGWIGYTLSKSSRNFELINNSNDFPAKYDRRHDLSIVSHYPLSKRWDLSALFTYATGNTYTKPVSRYLISGNVINEYGSYNGSRMPAYHRMDLAATYKLKKAKAFNSELSFSVYNIYNRQNPIYIYFLAQGDIEKQRVSIKPKSVVLLPILPSINYRLTLK
jgi:hypothetical protein